MRSVATSAISFVLATSLIGLVGCQKKGKPSPPPMVNIGPENQADMIILFDRDVSDQEISNFIETDLSDQVEMGHWPKPGIRMLTTLTTKAGQNGVAVYLEESPEGSAFPQGFLAQKHSLKFTVVRNTRPVDL